MFVLDDVVDEEARCPVCGDLIDYCQGHGPLGDPVGYAVMEDHNRGDHEGCHDPAACAALDAEWDIPDDGRIRS